MKPVDCPHCGIRLDPSLADADARLQCSQCGRRLKLARKRDLRQGRVTEGLGLAEGPASSPPGNLPSKSGFSPLDSAGGELLPPPSHLPLPARPSGLDLPALEADPLRGELFAEDQKGTPLIASPLRATRNSDEVLREAARRRTERLRWSAAGLTLLVAACSVALYFLAYPPRLSVSVRGGAAARGGDKADPFDPSAPAVEAGPPGPDSPAAREVPAAATSAPEELVPAVEVAPPAPIAWGELRTVGRRDLEKLWARVHPYVFRLTARKPSGERTFSGVLIDARGWVATSLSAVEGSSSIEAWPAPADPLAEDAAENLHDPVRGVLAIDRARDLCLLQVNRRLVNAVAPLRPTEKLLVPGKTLVQASAVGAERLAWLTEARIARSDPSAFPAEVREAIERRAIDLAPYWPGHESPLSQGVGAGLFTADGELAGVNTGLSAGGVHYFAEAKWIPDLAQSAREPAAALSSLIPPGATGDPAAAARSPEAGSNAGDQAGDSPFAAGHEAEPIARRLAETARACAGFDWLPDDSPQQQAALAAGLAAWREARGLVRSRRLFPEDATKLSRQLAFWTSEIKSKLLNLDRAGLTECNRRGWESLATKTAEPRALFVRVVLQPGTSPRFGGADTATLELIGLGQFVVATLDGETAPLLPDSEWLVVVNLGSEEQTTVSPQPGQPAAARRGAQLREIAEIKSAGLKLETPPPPAGDGGE